MEVLDNGECEDGEGGLQMEIRVPFSSHGGWPNSLESKRERIQTKYWKD